jgi:hypothetical protein
MAEISEDWEALLGPGIELLGLDREESDSSVRLVARYRFVGKVRVSTATGETVVAAHAALRERLVFDRVRLGFEAVAWRSQGLEVQPSAGRALVSETAWRCGIESFTSAAATIRSCSPSVSCNATHDLRQGGVTRLDGILACVGDARSSPLRSGGSC